MSIPLFVNEGKPMHVQLQECERQLIADALAATSWNITRTASRLGIHRGHLHRRMKALGVTRERRSEIEAADSTANDLFSLESKLRAREAGR